MMDEVFFAPYTDPLHNVVFCSSYKDRILAQGSGRGMQVPYWIEVGHKKFYPEMWHDHSFQVAHPNYFGPRFKYLRGACPEVADRKRAGVKARKHRARMTQAKTQNPNPQTPNPK